MSKANEGIEELMMMMPEQKGLIRTSTQQMSTHLVFLDEDGFPIINEAFALDPNTSDNTDFALEAEDVIDWTELDPFSEGRY